MNIKNHQINILETILEQPLTSNLMTKSQFNTQWSVLVYDRFSKRVLQSIANLELFEKTNVPIQLKFEEKRTKIGDVSAIYLISNTEESIEKFLFDLKESIYDHYYLNFNGIIEQAFLKKLATEVSKIGKSEKIKQVTSQYLNYIPISSNMFTLGIENCYWKLFHPQSKEEDIKHLCQEIAHRLLCFFLSTNTIPIIRATKGSASEMIAGMLNNLFETFLTSNPKWLKKKEKSSFFPKNGRTMIFLADRNLDFRILLHHSWIYQALIYDLMQIKENRITFKTDNKDEKEKEKEKEEEEEQEKTDYEKLFDKKKEQTNDQEEKQKKKNEQKEINKYSLLFPNESLDIVNEKETIFLNEKDDFWLENKNLPYPDVADNVAKRSKILMKQQKLGSTKSKDGYSNDLSLKEQFSKRTKEITDKLIKLDNLRLEKKKIQTHNTLCSLITDQLEKRKLGQFYEEEKAIMTSKKISKSIKRDMVDLLNDENNVNTYDKWRLFLIYFFSQPELDNVELMELIELFDPKNIFIDVFNHLKESKRFNLETISNTKTKSNIQRVIINRRRDKTEDLEFPICSVVKSSLKEEEKFSNFDPLQNYLDSEKSKIISNQKIKSTVVFMVGGGRLLELQNLQEYFKNSSNTLIYGVTDILNGENFIKNYYN
ncbi:sec1 family domain-containing protein [Anaeramoeba flamelloides]|uniref:Sec1 family domain-containing protein n=1 Tax=Anaeramoeba flamelloides TaxID=1746091 RepID=A0ABQ8Z555_9EUKA|nr:sec1 family domain-containing protein [Anaeramoeba flamelloides]